MSDGHGYTPFHQILAHTLLMESFPESCSKDTKYESIILSDKFQFFLSTIKRSSSSSAFTQLAVGLLLWTDGWDPSTSSKSNRSPMEELFLRGNYYSRWETTCSSSCGTTCIQFACICWLPVCLTCPNRLTVEDKAFFEKKPDITKLSPI
jgi:hypothetical protein